MALVTEDRTVPLTIGASLVAGGDGTYPVMNPAHPDEVVLAAPSASLEQLGQRAASVQIDVLAKTLDQANSKFLDTNKSPSRKVGELDNRGSHFYLALYWAQALAAQDEDAALKSKFTAVAEALTRGEARIVEELNRVQGKPVDIGGYYHPDLTRVDQAMRPSASLNAALALLSV